MPKLISKCPKCGTKNEVKTHASTRLDKGAPVVCTNCSLRFCAALSEKDVDELFEEASVSPVIKGEEDYVLEGIYYPKP